MQRMLYSIALLVGLVVAPSSAFTTGGGRAGGGRLELTNWRNTNAKCSPCASASAARSRHLPSSSPYALNQKALPRTGSSAIAAASTTGPIVTPTAMSAVLTLLLASDVLGRMLSRRSTRGTMTSTTSTSLQAASLEEASLYRPSSPSPDNGDGTTTWSAPALFTPDDSRPIVLFDGSCNLCNWGVQLMLDHDSCSVDSRGNLRIAALQSRVGTLLLARLNDRTRKDVLRNAALGGDQYKSIVVCGPSRTWTNTAAVLKMGRSMGFPFRPLALVAWLIPPFIRNLVYRWLSRNRKRLFGERDECRLWDDRWDTRFVDDSLLGGQGSQGGDLFADSNAPAPSAGDEDGGQSIGKGDQVRITYPEAVVVRHAAAFPKGVCISGCSGVVKEVNANNLVVRFDLSESLDEDKAKSSEGVEFQAYVTNDQVTKIQ